MEQFADEFEREAAQLRHEVKQLQCKLEESKTLQSIHERDLKNAIDYIDAITKQRDILYKAIKDYGTKKNWRHTETGFNLFTLESNGMGPAHDAVFNIDPLLKYTGKTFPIRLAQIMDIIYQIDNLAERGMTQPSDKLFKYLEEIKHLTFITIKKSKQSS